ncbi:MAG: tetratricopeptide repeat protein [Ignavibacteriaceae bacterium]|nr:tetratricopeptide repeat protein [Ignavibacteriaceae bacterium]
MSEKNVSEIAIKAQELVELSEELLANDSLKLFEQANELSEKISGIVKDKKFSDGQFNKLYIQVQSKRLAAYRITRVQDVKINIHEIQNILASIPEKENYLDEIAELNVGLSEIYFQKSEFDKAIELLNETLKIAKKTSNSRTEFIAYNNLGRLYWQSSNYSDALVYFLKAIDASKKYDRCLEHYKPYNNAGIIFLSSGLMEKALSYYHKALKIADDFNDSFAKSVIYLNLGIYYTDIGDSEKTLEYYSKSLAEQQKINNKSGLAQTFSNFAVFYINSGEYNKAYEYALKGLETAKQFHSKYEIANAYSDVAIIETRLKYTDKAKENFNKALEVCKSINNVFTEIKIYDGLSELNKSNFKESLRYAKLSYDCAVKLDDKRLIANACHNLSGIFEGVRDFEQALKFKNELMDLRETMKSEEYQNKTAIMQADFEFRKAKERADILTVKNEELVRMNKKLEILNEDKNEFLGIAAHDLRNPLGAIIGNCNYLISICPKSEHPTEFLEILEDINESADNMLQLINKLLDINRIEEGNLDIVKVEFDLLTLLKEIIKSFERLLSSKTQAIEIKTSENAVRIFNDKNIIRQILSNIISNALKFSPPETKIEIAVIDSNSSVGIYIKDRGPGFPSMSEENLFRKYSVKFNKPTGGEESTGLGLSIIKKLSDLIGAEVSLHSTSPKGSIFRFEIKKV